MRFSIALVLLGLIGCGGGGKPAPATPTPTDPPAAPAKPDPVSPKPAAPTLDEAAVKAMSEGFLALLDKSDPSFADKLGPAFVLFQSEHMVDKELLIKLAKMRVERGAPPTTRTVDKEDEHAYISPSVATYIGFVTTHYPAFGNAPAEDQEGYWTLVWVPEGGAWKLAHMQYQKGGIDAERDIWNERYSHPTGFRTDPNQLLIDTIKGRKAGKALDLASGQGRNLVYLATKGWQATGVDISTVGHKVAQEAAAKAKVKVETVEADMTKWDFGKDKWDLVAMIYAGHRKDIVEKAKASIKKKGLFVTEFFAADAQMAKSGIGGWSAGELAAMFKDGWKILKDDVVEDTADWSLSKQKLQRFVAERQ